MRAKNYPGSHERLIKASHTSGTERRGKTLEDLVDLRNTRRMDDKRSNGIRGNSAYRGLCRMGRLTRRCKVADLYFLVPACVALFPQCGKLGMDSCVPIRAFRGIRAGGDVLIVR